MTWAATRRRWAWRPTTARSASTWTSSTCSCSCSACSATAARAHSSFGNSGTPAGDCRGLLLSDDREAALVEEAQDLIQVVDPPQDVPALTQDRPGALPPDERGPFLDAVEGRFGVAAEHREHRRVVQTVHA